MYDVQLCEKTHQFHLSNKMSTVFHNVRTFRIIYLNFHLLCRFKVLYLTVCKLTVLISFPFSIILSRFVLFESTALSCPIISEVDSDISVNFILDISACISFNLYIYCLRTGSSTIHFKRKWIIFSVSISQSLHMEDSFSINFERFSCKM